MLNKLYKASALNSINVKAVNSTANDKKLTTSQTTQSPIQASNSNSNDQSLKIKFTRKSRSRSLSKKRSFKKVNKSRIFINRKK